MFKFFRRSKNKSRKNDANQTPKNSKNEQLQIPAQETINYAACAQTNGNDINKTHENLKFVDHIDHSIEVLVQKDRRTNDQQTPSKQYEFKKEKSSRNEIVDRKQCQTEDVSRRSVPIDRKSIKQDQQSQSERDHPSHKVSFNPFSKGREFFNGIMAKGRNRHRNRNNKQKENKNQIKNYQQANQQQGHKQQEQSELNCDNNKSGTPAKDDFYARENFQFGYQITKSKNSMNLIMRFEEKDGNDENDSRDENEQNSSSNNNDTIDTDSGNTSNDHEDVCAGANNDTLCENRNRVGQLDEHYDHHYTESNISELRQHQIEYYSDDQDERADYDDHEYHIEDIPHTIEEFGDQEKQHPQNFADNQSNDEAEQISELTECDRDRYFKIEMGQPNSKTSSTSNNCQDQQQESIKSDRNNIIIPTITVADYSDNEKGIINESEIFYDSEQSFDTEVDQLEKPIDIVDLSNELNSNSNSNNNNNDDEWHFVTNESDRVTIEDDPDLNNDHITSINSVNSHSENLSTTSSSAIDNQTWSPDSGLGSAGNILLIDSRTIVNDSENQLNCESDSFLRGSSTDCDENLLQSDYEIIYDNDDNDNDKSGQHILIDSISLPDVVVESTGMGSSSSIPIKVETVEDISTAASHTNDDNKQKDNEKRDLVNQEARFSAQLEEAQKIAFTAQAKVNDLQAKIDELEKELSIKSWNVDRLQAELDSAQKEDTCVRKRLKILEDEKESLKEQFTDKEAELNSKYEELENDYKELQEKYEQLQSFSRSLQTQLAFAQSDAEQCRLEKERLQEEKEEELKNLREALEKSHQDKKELEEKWQKEFETLRTQNADKEEQLLTDCEWQMRAMQKNCKEKIEIAEKAKQEALERATEAEQKLDEQAETFRHLKTCEAELRQLRGLTSDQRQSIVSMTEQLEDLRADLESANQELEKQIEDVRKIKKQCEIQLSIKDREMIQKIEEARGEVALEWESRLLTEMTRLKAELETVNIEDKQEALRKLQEEHIEEIKALTTRYTANEQELRDELESLNKELEEKYVEYKELQERTDATILETRLHLERADRDYQRAMNREEEKREALCEQMKKEFEKEKLEMEEKFRERLSQVKDEFAKELTNTTEELTIRHRKQLELQWEQLIAEKEEALQAMESRHRIRLEEAENRIKDLEIEHQRDLKELKNNFDVERTTLESRDLHNSQEIEQLHRKCRCLTNLFEEMRMRYERRDPRPEDLQEISELRSRCESQERDLQFLTERLRDMQMHMEESQQLESPQPHPKRKPVRKPPPKTIPTSCDVIYEENEERDSPPKENGVNGTTTTTNEVIENETAES